MWASVRNSLTIFLFLLGTTANADGITGISKTNKLFSQAEEAFKANDLKGAIKAYEEALRESEEIPPQVYMNLGHAYYQTKNWNKAQKRYMEAIALTESPAFRSVAYQQLGNILFQNKNYKGSLEWYRKSLKENPENKNARFNYELALKLSQEQEKNNPQDPKADQQKKEKDKKDARENSKQEKGQENKPEPKQGSEEKNKEQEQKGGPKANDKEKNKPGAPKPGENQREAEQKQENGEQQKPDPQGEENQAKKDKESNMDDPESQRLDRQKLRETGLSEDQARNLLQAMRQSEVKYLQQRRFKSQKGGSSAKGKPKW